MWAIQTLIYRQLLTFVKVSPRYKSLLWCVATIVCCYLLAMYDVSVSFHNQPLDRTTALDLIVLYLTTRWQPCIEVDCVIQILVCRITAGGRTCATVIGFRKGKTY